MPSGMCSGAGMFSLLTTGDTCHLKFLQTASTEANTFYVEFGEWKHFGFNRKKHSVSIARNVGRYDECVWPHRISFFRIIWAKYMIFYATSQRNECSDRCDGINKCVWYKCIVDIIARAAISATVKSQRNCTRWIHCNMLESMIALPTETVRVRSALRLKCCENNVGAVVCTAK